jgi:serine-type D-Ala-D-Ala carboxypeptidase/endopeptidase (penicillin-binding protein 4)
MASSLASQSFHLYNIEQLGKTLLRTSYIVLLTFIMACGPSKYISRQSNNLILSDSNFAAAHVGISIYDPSSSNYLYEHQAEKYFIPASNTKLYTCYAAMKHLGDSLIGIRYSKSNDTLSIWKSADPTLLHPDFKNHPVYEFFLSYKTKNSVLQKFSGWKDEALGNGWAWNDYLEDYAAERSAFPIYGNLIKITVLPKEKRTSERNQNNRSYIRALEVIPNSFDIGINFTLPLEDPAADLKFKLLRPKESNSFYWEPSRTLLPKEFNTPMSTTEPVYDLSLKLLADTAHVTFRETGSYSTKNGFDWSKLNLSVIHSQPTDSLLKPMMHRSDNFFAEQTLLMVSNEMTGVMNDEKIIDSLLKTDFKDLPQKPRWVDGSGLSRYNLFSPNDMVTVLNKMKNEFSWNRITTILATGNEGTLTNYYVNLKDRIFAKTGTLSNNVAISGFLITKQNKTLIFSVLVNNHMGSTTQIRRAVEKFLTSIADKY